MENHWSERTQDGGVDQERGYGPVFVCIRLVLAYLPNRMNAQTPSGHSKTDALNQVSGEFPKAPTAFEN